SRCPGVTPSPRGGGLGRGAPLLPLPLPGGLGGAWPPNSIEGWGEGDQTSQSNLGSRELGPVRVFLTGAGVLLFIGLIRNQTPMMLLALLLVLAVVVASVWAHFAPRGVTFHRFFDPPRIFPGQETDYVV